jgi:hypothetical protein
MCVSWFNVNRAPMTEARAASYHDFLTNDDGGGVSGARMVFFKSQQSGEAGMKRRIRVHWFIGLAIETLVLVAFVVVAVFFSAGRSWVWDDLSEALISLDSDRIETCDVRCFYPLTQIDLKR